MLVVRDTNVVVSAMLSADGASARLLRLLADGRFEIAVSVPMVLEYEEVLLQLSAAPGWSPVDVATIIEFLCKVGRPAQRRFAWRPALRDADDEFVLELVIASSADYLLTSNVRDFTAGRAFGVTVVTPGQFLRRLEQIA